MTYDFYAMTYSDESTEDDQLSSAWWSFVVRFSSLFHRPAHNFTVWLTFTATSGNCFQKPSTKQTDTATDFQVDKAAVEQIFCLLCLL